MAGNSVQFSIKPNDGGSNGEITDAQVVDNVVFQISSDGQAIIGKRKDFNNFLGNYKLYVQTGILTERMRVAVYNSNDWADYVFKKDYKLMLLDRLQLYIEANNHLPDVPSANEVVATGIDVQQMDATLLRKIEELTLYVLQQQKEIDQLKVQLHKTK